MRSRCTSFGASSLERKFLTNFHRRLYHPQISLIFPRWPRRRRLNSTQFRPHLLYQRKRLLSLAHHHRPTTRIRTFRKSTELRFVSNGLSYLWEINIIYGPPVIRIHVSLTVHKRNATHRCALCLLNRRANVYYRLGCL